MTTRSRVLADVYRRLADADFARRFSALADDGTRPIVPALPSDHVSEMLRQVVLAGGRANVVTASFDGFVVFEAEAGGSDVRPHCDVHQIEADTTVGVLLAHMMEVAGQGVQTYRWSEGGKSGSAKHPSLVQAPAS